MKRFNVDLDESLEEEEVQVIKKVKKVPPPIVIPPRSPIFMDLTSPEIIDLRTPKVVISPIFFSTPKADRIMPQPKCLFHMPDSTRLLKQDDWMCVEALLSLEKPR